MKHYITAKFKSEITREQKMEMLPDIAEIFGHLIWMDGINDVSVYPNCIDRSNRADVMIEIDMEKDALSVYDECIWHKLWKDKYGELLENKTVFDRE